MSGLLSLVIPCFNEAENVDRLRRELLPVAAELVKRGPVELILVDDGSLDETWPRLLATFAEPGVPDLAVRFARHPENRGLGAAVRTGLAAARGEVIVTTDSDGTYRYTEIPALLDRLTPDVDLVTASPYHPRGRVVGVPGYRLLLSQGSSLLYRLLVDWRVHTYTALFRAYRRPVAEQVDFASDGFLGGTELLVKALLRGFRVAEHPTELHTRVLGVSKIKVFRTIRAHLGFQARILGHRLGLRRLGPTLNAPTGVRA